MAHAGHGGSDILAIANSPVARWGWESGETDTVEEEKKAYIKPQLTEWGTIGGITAAGPGPATKDALNSGNQGRGGFS